MSLVGKRFAFILPRYYPGVVGGAETLCGELARKAYEGGSTVEIWTTCARDNRSWENDFPEGIEDYAGIPIRRFSVDERDLEQWIPLQIRLAQGVNLSVDEQFTWMKESVNSTSLYEYISEHHQDFDALFFAPYLFGTTFWGALLSPERSILIPCLHDEANAYLEIVSSMFRQVRGCLFNAEPEAELARALYGKHLRGGVVGMGFEDTAPLNRDNSVEHQQFFKDDTTSYVLYLGRMETGKNAHILLDHFVEGKEQGLIPKELRLVIAGGGAFSDLERPQYSERTDILPVGRVSEEEKYLLLRDALALIQPSVNESFCIVMMEAWLAGTPVLVSDACAVTKDHVLRSGGGLYFRDTLDLAGALKTLAEDSALQAELGDSGKRYVKTQYNWQAVMGRFEEEVGRLLKANTDNRKASPEEKSV